MCTNADVVSQTFCTLIKPFHSVTLCKFEWSNTGIKCQSRKNCATLFVHRNQSLRINENERKQRSDGESEGTKDSVVKTKS